MVRALRAALLFLAWSTSGPRLPASPPPPCFEPDEAGWHATHVVVVIAGKESGNTFEVLDSWKGGLRSRDTLELPDLAFLNRRALPRLRAVAGDGENTDGAAVRLILFLKWTPEGGDPAKETWEPAHRSGEFRYAVAWSEGGRTYRWQRNNFRPAADIVPVGMTEPEMRELVRQVARRRDAFDRAAALTDPGRRAEALRPIAGSKHYATREAALESLVECGQHALPALHTLLADDSLWMYHADYVRAVGKAGGAEAERELVAILGQELAFWKSRGPKLPVRWCDGAGVAGDEQERLRARSFVALQAMQGLGGIRHTDGGRVGYAAAGSSPIEGLGDVRCAEGCKAVRKFRDFWQSLPQLGDHKWMGAECDRILSGSKE